MFSYVALTESCQEWTSSTEQHLLLYKAFDWEAPQFHHVGLLLDTNGQKLSKRNFGGDLSVFRNDMAIVPQALINFLALLGWAHEERDDYMTMDDLIKRVRHTQRAMGPC